MTVIEVTPATIYCSTDDRDELLALIAFIQTNFARMETRGQKAVTLYEYRELMPPEYDGDGADKDVDA